MHLVQRQLTLLVSIQLILDHQHLHLERQRLADHLHHSNFRVCRAFGGFGSGFLFLRHVFQFLRRHGFGPEFVEESTAGYGLACACE
jgi:hypothetical protein